MSLQQKAKIDPAVRARLEELGADVVRSKLIAIMKVRDFAQQDEPQDLGDLSATRKEMQEWLKEKAASDRRWVIVAAIAAVAAAIISLLAAIISLFAWLFPRSSSLF